MKRALLLATLVTLPTSLACKKQEAPEAMVDAVRPATSKVHNPTVERAMSQIRETFSRVHFAFDSSSLEGQSKALLQANADITQRQREIAIEIQGHCDERGTADYNLALGERRATAVRSYMSGLGVAPRRPQTVSYGEEPPLAAGEGEVVWSENRRAESRVHAGETVALSTVQ